MAKAARNAIRVLAAVLIVAGYFPALDQVLRKVGHPGLPDEAHGDHVIAVWLASVAGLLLWALFSPWILGRFLLALVMTAPAVLAGLAFAFFAAVGGPDARAGAPPLVILAVLLGTVLLTVPALAWLHLEWVTRSDVSPRARTAWVLALGLLLLGLAWTSRAAWEVRRERREAFQRIWEKNRSLVRPAAPEARPTPTP